MTRVVFICLIIAENAKSAIWDKERTLGTQIIMIKSKPPRIHLVYSKKVE